MLYEQNRGIDYQKTQPFCFQILKIQIKISIIMKLQVTYIYNPY